MLYLALIAQSAAFVAVVWLLLRHLRGRDAALERDRRRARADEIQTLLQRIQAPQQAVLEHAVQHAGPPPDGSPRSERESAEASDEQLRARLMVEEIEALERDQLRAVGFDLEPQSGGCSRSSGRATTTGSSTRAGSLSFQTAGMVGVASPSKPNYRIRNTYNWVRMVVEAKTSAATQRVPGYEVTPSTDDPTTRPPPASPARSPRTATTSGASAASPPRPSPPPS
jgi:hypothetical protein